MAVSEHQPAALPFMSATDTNVVVIPWRNLPSIRQLPRLVAIVGTGARTDRVFVKRHVDEGAVLLEGGRGGQSLSMYVSVWVGWGFMAGVGGGGVWGLGLGF